MEYTKEFKMLIAKRAMKAKTYSEVGREYGVSVKQIKNWSELYRKYGELAFDKEGPEIHTKQRIREMEKYISDLEEENEILKKVTAVFSKRQK